MKIPGWFNFSDFYVKIIKRFHKAHFVEVGGFLGASCCFMANLIKKSGKEIKFDVIDIWEDTGSVSQKKITRKLKKSIYEEFLENVRRAGAQNINPIKMDSISASALYEDESLDFVFIDACHQYEAVSMDIKHWLPKIKPGGILAGHDFSGPGVRKAVKEIFGQKFRRISRDCWMVEI